MHYGLKKPFLEDMLQMKGGYQLSLVEFYNIGWLVGKSNLPKVSQTRWYNMGVTWQKFCFQSLYAKETEFKFPLDGPHGSGTDSTLPYMVAISQEMTFKKSL